MTESRRLRTQAERDADGQAWRATAATRPGYATYPQTLPGSPSWWARYGEPEIHHHAPARPPHLGPPPVDGETCKRWCGFCHLPAAEPDRVEAEPASAAVVERIGGVGDALPPIPDHCYPSDAVELDPAPRRRWWHRYTRRTR